LKTKNAAAASKLTDKYMVPVLRSSFCILEELSRSGALGLNEITVRTGISKSTVFRILTTLTQLGYIVRDGNRSYYIGQSMADLVRPQAKMEAIRRAAMPEMLQLRDKFGETVNLGYLELDKVTYAEVVPSEYALRLHEKPGATICLHASALGKAILAFSDEEYASSLIRGRELQMITRNTITDPEEFMAELKKVRDHGFAFDRGETSLLATCVAAPLLNAAGKAVAALSISGPTSRFNPRKDSEVVETLLKSVATISRQLRSPAHASLNGDAPKASRRRVG